MNWNLVCYIILGVALIVALVAFLILFFRTGMKDDLQAYIAEAEKLFPKDIPDYQNKRLQYVLDAFKNKYKWFAWLMNAVKYIAKFCATYKIITK